MTLCLVASVAWLFSLLRKGRKQYRELEESTFYGEFAHLSWILIVFVLTYVVRFFSDYFYLAPLIEDTNKLVECTIDGEDTYCISANVIIYYVWTSLIFDFLPIVILIYFHHQAFSREMDNKRQGSMI